MGSYKQEGQELQTRSPMAMGDQHCPEGGPPRTILLKTPPQGSMSASYKRYLEREQREVLRAAQKPTATARACLPSTTSCLQTSLSPPVRGR